MEIRFELKGLDCPHCAEVIRAGASKLPGVKDAQMNLVGQTLTLDVEPGAEDGLTEQVRQIVLSHEPGVVVTRKAARNTVVPRAAEPEDPERKKMILRLVLGGVLFGLGLLAEHGASLALLLAAYGVLGYDVVLKAARNLLRGRVFDENFLMSLSSIGAFVIGEHPEAVAVMLLYQVGEFFQSMAVRRSRRSIASLMDIRPDEAWLLRGGEAVQVDARSVDVGETVLVKPGERIALDGVVVAGESLLDTAALTGESVPRRAGKGSQVYSGCINTTGALTVRVTRSFGDSTASRILELVENASARKAPAEKFITKFARWYTPAVTAMAALLAVIPPLVLGGGWTEWIHRSFVFLVVSCPCALVISVPLTYFGGIGAASRHGVLVKGGNVLDALNHVGMVVMDKTGTLTEGKFRVVAKLPAPGVTEEYLLRRAALAERDSNHPIALSIREAMPGVGGRVSDYCEFPGQGVAATVDGHWLLAGNAALMETEGIDYVPCGQTGTKVYVAEDGAYLGCVVINDALKPDSKSAVASLRAMGAEKLVMLTGDDSSIANDIGTTLGLDAWYAQLLPQDKVTILEALEAEKRPGTMVAYLGDGINDAPVLSRADIGVAMGGLGADAAIEAADVVLMTDEPGKLVEAVALARDTRKIVKQNILFALGVKAVFLVLGALGVTGMWVAVFGDVGVAMLAVLNAMRMLKK